MVSDDERRKLHEVLGKELGDKIADSLHVHKKAEPKKVEPKKDKK